MKRNLLSLAVASACLGAVVFAAPAVAMSGAGQTVPAASSTAMQQQQPQERQEKSDKDEKDEKDKSRAPAKKMQAVEVTGFISSIENSTALKRNSDSIVEAVSAEQMGKLPGVSIADTLGRLPGLTVQRVSGRPQVLTIHGLGPDFSTALVNGGQQVSTSNNRDVEFDQYPSSWFNDVVVHLTPSANLVGQGLSGTVDMQTIRPLEKEGPEAAVNAHYIWNGMSQLSDGPGVSNKGYNLNGVWVNQFADHTFGVTLGVNFENNPSQIEHQAPWGYETVDHDGNAMPMVVTGSKNYGITDSMKRNGFLATFQWQPNEHFTSTFDLTWDHFSEAQQAKGMELPLFYGSGTVDPVPTLVPGDVTGDFVKTGTYRNINTVVRNDYNKTTARVYNFHWDNRIQFDEDWSADIDASYSRATRRDLMVESYSGTGYYYGGPAGDRHGPAADIGFSELDNGMLYITSAPDYANGQVLTDPQGWGEGSDLVQGGFINAPHTDDYLAQLRLGVKRNFVSGPFTSVELGVVRGTRNKTYDIDQTFLIFPGGAQTAALPDGYATGDPLAWMGVGPQVIYNPMDLIAGGTYELYPTELSSIAVPPNWKVRERDLTSYLQFNLDTAVGGVSLRGNFGIQVAHTAQTSEGQRAAASDGGTSGTNVELLPVSGGTSYTRYLPSANLIFGFTDDDDLRVSAARTMVRPRMDQMSASLGVSGDPTHLSSTDPNLSYFSASGGNAELMPTRADNYNISYEHYFTGGSGYECHSADSKASDLCRGGGGYFAVSGYFLKLSDYIDPNAAYLYDFKDFVSSYLTPEQQKQLGTTMGIVSGPVNDGHGYVKGAQVTLNLPLNVVTPALDGFGVILTGNRTESSLVYGDNPDPITVPGLSKWVANGTIYYQRGGFQARISDSYRSSFLGRVSGISATRVEQNIQGGSTYDAQVSYTFQSGVLEGLTLLAQGSNLSNKTFITYQNHDPRQVLTWERYGRRYDIGVSYKF